jgi:hypothetical protein
MTIKKLNIHNNKFFSTNLVVTIAKSSLYLIMQNTTKTYGTVEVQLHKSITLALRGGESSDSHPAAVSLMKETQHQTERQQWGIKIGMDCMAERTVSGAVRKQTPAPSTPNSSFLILLPLKYWGLVYLNAVISHS